MTIEIPTVDPPRILGICGSLRAGRWGVGITSFVEQIESLGSESELSEFLERESLAHLQNFVDSGRNEGLSFEELYRNLKRDKGRHGLSNSEVALAASLWSARQFGCDIDAVGLVEHFPPSGKAQRLDELKAKLIAADGIVLSTPVYFGDRSSLSHDLMRLIQSDEELREAMQGTVYVGDAVGAKRNGGQETTLIYHILDMANAGLLAVGNDSDTTSQYGGTVHAGDVGQAWKDDYGLETSRGAGRRIARVTRQLALAKHGTLDDELRVAFWLLQDKDDIARGWIERLVTDAAQQGVKIKPVLLEIMDGDVNRCLACDICPTDVGVDGEYRCIIKKKGDFLKLEHETLWDVDAIVPVGFTASDHSGIRSQYQQFMERTRYLRRGDYVFTDLVTAPLIVEEVGTGDSLHMRMLTSTLRHHTVLSRPMRAVLHEGRALNTDAVLADWRRFLATARDMTVGRLMNALEAFEAAKYNPVGYILSAEKDAEDIKLMRRQAATTDRQDRARAQAFARVTPVTVGGADVEVLPIGDRDPAPARS
ncbi:MAG: flavodoxin family protein [Phycisphaerales bacterium]